MSIPPGTTGTTIGGVSRCWRGRARTSPRARCRVTTSTCSTRMTGRRRWPRLSPLRARPRAGGEEHRHHPQHRLPGLVRGTPLPRSGPAPEAWSVDGVEYYGQIGYLKAGLRTADAITTVSPTYAEEIHRVQYGMGLEGLIAARAECVSGIVNGIDPAIWSPKADAALPAPSPSTRWTIASPTSARSSRRSGWMRMTARSSPSSAA